MRDTLILSQLSDPMLEGGHSLKAWGERLGFGKLDYNDFSHFNEEMLEYCIKDVQLTHKLYRHLLPTLKKYSKKSMLIEHQVRAIVNKQEENGFKLDIEQADKLCAKLEEEADKIVKDFLNVCQGKSKLFISKFLPPIVNSNKSFEIITRKPILPSQEEVKINHKSRSAKLRIAKRTQFGAVFNREVAA